MEEEKQKSKFIVLVWKIYGNPKTETFLFKSVGEKNFIRREKKKYLKSEALWQWWNVPFVSPV